MINYVNETLSELEKKFTQYSKQSKARANAPQPDENIANPYRLLNKEFGDLQVLFDENVPQVAATLTKAEAVYLFECFTS